MTTCTEIETIATQGVNPAQMAARFYNAFRSCTRMRRRPLVVAVTWREMAENQATLPRELDVAEPGCAALKAAMSTEFRPLALAAAVVGVDDPIQRAARLDQALPQADPVRNPVPLAPDSRVERHRPRGLAAMSPETALMKLGATT